MMWHTTMTNFKTTLWLTLLCGLTIVFVQCLDYLYVRYLPSFPFYLSFCDVHLIWNTGLLLGIFASIDSITIIIMSCLFCLWLLHSLVMSQSMIESLAIVLIIGGGGSNLCHRLLLGAVPDFITCNLYWIQTPYFNFGDILITVGVGCLLIQYLLVIKMRA